MKRIIMAAMIVSLAACGGDKDDVATEQQQEWESRTQSLVYAFPDNGQQEVPVPSPVVLRFSSPVVDTSPQIVLHDADGAVVPTDAIEWVDGNRSLVIQPTDKLAPLTEYVVEIPEVKLEKGVAPKNEIRFTTRGLFEGPKSLVAEDTFEITRMIPDGKNFPVMDFSSFRVQFSQPLDQTTVKYGDGADATVQLVGPEGLVDAYLLVSDRYITVDPKDDLKPGAEYTLNLTTGITSTYGETLPGGSFGNPGDTLAVSFKSTPQDTTSPTTGKRVSMVQDVAKTGELSELTGQPINLVPMASVLLGEDTATQAYGTVAAELAFVPKFPDVTPFRVKRGSLIEGASIDVLIGGEVPAGFKSGKVRMDFLSDATGYLVPNPYSKADDAPRQVRLFMDVAVSTETPAANGAITQDLLHIELVGTSIVEDGRMVINAVGVVEPDVLGSERATGILSFYMKAFEDQDNPPQIIGDTNPPTIQSWWPNENVGVFSKESGVIINFSEPVDELTVNPDNIKIIKSGVQVDSVEHLDGAALIIKPRDGFEYGAEYLIHIGGGVSDLSGNKIGYSSEKVIRIPLGAERVEKEFIDRLGNVSIADIERKHSPLVLSVYPGFPCVIDDSNGIDLSKKIVGRCKGYLAGWDEGDEGDKRNADDLVPLQSVSPDHPIIVNFSKDMNNNSINRNTFYVEEVDFQGNSVSIVDGFIKRRERTIEFWPNQSWREGVAYRYTLVSSESVSYSCMYTICDEDGLPLQTKLWEVVTRTIPPIFDRQYLTEHVPVSPTFGGDNMVQYFIGGTKNDNVIQNLSAKSQDRNANFYIDRVDSERDLEMRSNFTPANQLGFEYINAVLSGEAENAAENQPLISESQDYPGGVREDIDPGGVVPPQNSVKILSGLVNPEPFYLEDILSNNFRFLLAGINIGCGYKEIVDDPDYFFGRHIPVDPCPREKFSYFNSSIVSEVTNEYVPGKGLKVLLWPAQIMATSISQRVASGEGVGYVPSGPQVMRLRYKKDNDDCIEGNGIICSRTSPIEAWIYESSNGPRLRATVDMYIDAPLLSENIANNLSLVGQNVEVNLLSYPVTMNLDGAVKFNQDGTMSVEQYNLDEVVINLKLSMSGTEVNNIKLIIPAYGSRLNYQSEAIIN